MSGKREIPIVPVAKVTPGFVKTGTWRVYKPVIDLSRCSRCATCWLYCPETAITLDKDGYPHIDYNYCKGCGICANECPTKAISMVEER